MINPPVGVLRAELALTGHVEEIEFSGNLFVDVDDDDDVIEGPVVIYTLDRHRLVGMLAAARAGEPDDSILLALDAAALAEPTIPGGDDL